MLRHKFAVVLALAAFAASGTATAAYAMFTSRGTAVQPVSTQTLQPPTGVAASVTSQCKSSKTQQVTVTWTGSASAFATGYTIQRNSTVVATVGTTTTSWVDNSVAHSTTYTYTVLATYQQWSSGTAAGVTTC